MIRIRISSFSDLKPLDLAASARANVEMISSNPAFAEITPAVSVVQNFVSDFSSKVVLAKNGSAIQKNDRDAAKTIVLNCLVQWSLFIEMKANEKSTEEEKIALVRAAGFVPVVRGGKIGMLSAVTNIRTKSLTHAVSLSWCAVPGAHSYKVMKTSGYGNDKSIWTEQEITSRVRITVPCMPAEVVSFIIYPLGTSGRGPQSPIVTCLGGL